MAIPPSYPPYQQPLLDGRTGIVTKPWQLFFLSLVSQSGVVVAIPDGSLGLDQLQPIASPRLLGRGASGMGPVEPITLGAGLALMGTVLSVTSSGVAASGYWTPITNGDPLSPELLFDANADCVVGFVPTPS
jgi:hypothetical protein